MADGMGARPEADGFAAPADVDPPRVGRYRIVARLGEGGMGRVYLGRSPSGRAVAVKVVRPDLAQDPDFRRRFAREVGAARKVNGFFTAGVVEADPEGSPAWLATAYVPGVSLGEAVVRHGAWPEDAVLALAAGLAEALEAIHAAGVIHRDLKPSNVLLAADGPRVIDFGISAATDSGASRLTQPGMLIGTPGFMSPEQLTGKPVGPASDVFALGGVVAFTAAGRSAFGTGAAEALNFRAVYEEPDLDALPPRVRALVADCLAKDPGARPTVGALLDRLAEERWGQDADQDTHEVGWLPDRVAADVRARATAPQAPVPATPDPRLLLWSSQAAGPTGPAAPHVEAPRPSTAPDVPAPHPPRGHDLPQDATTPRHPQDTTAPRSGRQAGLSRRRLLLGLAGAGVAGAGYTTWRLLDGTERRPGQRLWTFSTGKTVNSTPAVADGVVYIGSGDQRLYALDAATGKKRWAFETGDRVQSSPAVVDGVVYVGSGDGLLYAVDAVTGKRRWQYPAGAIHSAPVVVDGIVYTGSADGLHAVDAATGEKRWTALTPSYVYSTPAVVEGVVYVGSGDGLRAVDAATGTERWSALTDHIFSSSPAVAKGRIYIGGIDGLYCVNASDGMEYEDFPGGGPVGSSSPTVADGVVYVGGDNGDLYGVDAFTAKQRLKFPTADSVDSRPAVVDGVVYFGSDDGNLYAVDVRTSEQRWRFSAGDSIDSFFTPSSPVVSDGVLYIGSYAGKVYAIAV
ncbi:PQQ-binding-like beta-propeller repeat protein [Streptomyces neyagawaensis]|uniref:serine/threonine-protein kinase n=1 Tax=Streptomyces neyagawaensis TaxID=42238 RepID=UPI0006E14046|nr:serine/threonine-protein kinase [Streptomyces neyagawaensis]MCL6731009.1 PQQ-binding-like beta-propeller repeat protein [Streptomyces neyagawaensis]MDE1686269.1 PQQ-binding-like beta-propeller repeat protein [Streptomyces neyagawaensis]